MTKKLQNAHVLKRILILGFGSIGRRHARILHTLVPGAELSVFRSGHGKDTPELALMSNIFLDLTSAISWRPDAAVIASPAPFHQLQALALARHGIPFLIEKPIGTGHENFDEWDELLKYASNIPITVGYVFRHDPCASYVKDLIDNEHLGKILDADLYCGSWLPSWRPDSDYRHSVSSQRALGGGALLELSHEIDLAYWFFGPFQITFASLEQSKLLDIDVEDQVLLTGRSTNCPLISIRLNFCTLPARRVILIRCEKGEIEWNLLTGEVSVQSVDRPSSKYSTSQKFDDLFMLQAERFISSILRDCLPKCSLYDGIQVMKLINQARHKLIAP